MLTVAPTRPLPSGPAGRVAAAGHRHDIQVLRALAVGIVVLYHLGVPGFDAGFIGVDVFFVVSGYLISRLLLDELQTTGTVRLGRFMARRVRRLLPMSFVVLVATLLLIRWKLGPFEQLDAIGAGEAAATYRANFTFAARGTDYLTADQVSPFQHYWSLAIEEQFYLVLPIALVVLGVVVGRGRIVSAAAVAFGGVALVTFWLALQISESSPPEAYFLLHARAWEFLAGGLVAVMELRGVRPRSARPWRFAGLAGLVLAMLVSHHLDFPGPGAVPAVAATAALVWAGIGAGAGDFGGDAWSPARWIGDRSYSLYLWHWPPIVVFGLDGSSFTDRPLMRFLVLVGSVVAAAVTYEVIEKPLRNARLLRSTRRSMMLLAGLTVVGFLAVSALLQTGVSALFGPPAAPVTVDVLENAAPGVPRQVPVNVRPGLLEASDDLPELYANDCHVELEATEPAAVAACTFGGDGSGGTIVLLGDSHAAQWFDAVDRAATAIDAQLVTITKSGCSITGIADPRFPEACAAWRPAALEQLAEIDPDVVIAANVARPDERVDPTEWQDALAGGVAAIRAEVPGAGIAFVLDMPYATGNVTYCLADRSPEACSVAVDSAFDEAQRATAQAVADLVVDMIPLLCDGQICSPIAGGRPGLPGLRPSVRAPGRDPHAGVLRRDRRARSAPLTTRRTDSGWRRGGS